MTNPWRMLHLSTDLQSEEEDLTGLNRCMRLSQEEEQLLCLPCHLLKVQKKGSFKEKKKEANFVRKQKECSQIGKKCLWDLNDAHLLLNAIGLLFEILVKVF